MLKCLKVGFRGHRTCTISCISRLLAVCGRAAKLSRASFISKHNREGDVQRGRCRRLRRCLRHLGSCTCRVRAYKRREGDCSGASRSTAFVHLGHSCVKGSRLLPTCGLRTTVYSRCVTMVSMGPCTSSVRYFIPLVRGFGHACNRCPGCPITSTKCNSCGGCLCYRRRNVRGCVGFAVCGGRAASGGCRRGPCHTMGFTGSTSKGLLYPGNQGFLFGEARRIGCGGCKEARRLCRYRSYRKYRRGRRYYPETRGGQAVQVGRRLATVRRRILRGLRSVRNTLLEVGQDVRSRKAFNMLG